VNKTFSIGQQFTPRGKRKDLCTIIDIHTTTNESGEVVRIRYIAQHEFLGQIINAEYCAATVARGIK